MGNTHKVLRPFTAGVQRNPGELVDASDWKNAKALESQRYIERIDTATPFIGGAGPSPDPRLIQEAQARKGESKNSESGGIATMEEIEDAVADAEGNNESGEDLSGLTKDELIERAERNGVEVKSSMRKDEIIAAIEGAEK